MMICFSSQKVKAAVLRAGVASLSPKRYGLLVLIAAYLLVFIAFSASCGRGAVRGNAAKPSGHAVFNSQTENDISAYPAPAGVDPAVFRQLTIKLAELLKEKGKKPSAALTPGVGKVTGLVYDKDAKTLSWSYRNLGDYDVSGDVGVSDVVPIALHYMALTGDGQGDDALEAWIDGDANGEVGVSDVTTIARYYRSTVSGYRVFLSDIQSGPYTRTGEDAPFGGHGVFPKTFSVPIPDGTTGYLAVAPLDATGAEGPISDGVQIPAVNPPTGDPPQVIGVSPIYGVQSADITLSASVSGDAPFAYEWNLWMAAVPSFSTEASPTVRLGAPGVYDCSLTVTNDYGQDVFPFTLAVSSANLPPVAILTVWPPKGRVPFTPTFDASKSADVDGTIFKYEFDCDGDGTFETDNGQTSVLSHTYNEFGNVTASVRVTDNRGAQATASVSVTVLPMWLNDSPVAVLTADAYEGDLPLTVNFDASGSYDPDGAIESYDWDFDGGDYDLLDAGPKVSHTFTQPDPYATATVRVTDTGRAPATASVMVNVRGFHVNAGIESARDNTYVSIALLNGLPAICYKEENAEVLKFACAMDSLGSRWNAPVVVDGSGNVGEASSLFIADGKPAITYYDSIIGTMKYVRALDAEGTTWSGPVVLTQEGESAGLAAPAIVSGCPAVVYRDAVSKTLKYRRASDASGASWNSSVTVIPEYGWPSLRSLKVVDGRPAIVYYSKSSSALMYVRAADALGTLWETPVTVYSNPFPSEISAQLAVADNAPVICFRFLGGEDPGLWICRAGDVDGYLWDAPFKALSPFAPGFEVDSCSFGISAGVPAIAFSYNVNSNYELGFIRSLDAGANTWGTPILADDSPGSGGGYNIVSLCDGGDRPMIGFIRNNPAFGNQPAVASWY